MTTVHLTEMSEETLRKVAYIIGPSSAAQKALNNLRVRRENGEDAACYWDEHRHTILVGPRLTQEEE